MDCLGLLGNTLRRRRRTLSESKYNQQFQMPRKKNGTMFFQSK
jgi:hypothetical protein